MPKRKHHETKEDEESNSDSEESQNPQKRNKTSQNKVRIKEDIENESENGIIEEINLINFMCHKNLTIKLGPKINFIVGPNGSGKSAVLVALAICLGAKAGFTNRGSKLSDFIRTGCNGSTISVKLRNRGSEAYKHAIYGDSIIIERKLLRSGTSSYKVKNSSGNIISTHFSEVQVILDQFNIQISNPCSILMQDTARQFLTTSSHKDKYKFFMMATQLKELKDDFSFIQERLDTLDRTIYKKRQLFIPMQEKLKQYEQEYNQVTTLKDLEKKAEECKKMIAWAQVKDLEVNVNEHEKELKKLKEENEKMKNDKIELRNTIEEMKANLDNKTANIDAFTEKIKIAERIRIQAEQKVADLRKTKIHQTNKIKDAEKRMINLRGREKKVLEHIESVKRKIEEFNKQEIHKNQEQIEEKKLELEKVLAQQGELQEKKKEIEDELQAFSEDLEKLRSEEQRLINDRNSIMKDLTTARNAKKDQLRAFGDHIPQIKNLIKNDKNFTYEPVGPIGSLLRLKDNKWANAIESAVSSRNLKAFCVASIKDGRYLDELCKKKHLNPPPFIVQRAENQVYDTSKFRLDGLTSMLSVVSSDFPLVINCLIDQSKIEKKVLVTNANEAEAILQANPNPRFEIFTQRGDRYFVTNGSNNFVGAEKKSAEYISVDYDQRIRELEQTLARADPEVKKIGLERTRKEEERIPISQKLSAIKKEISNLQIKASNIQKDINELENRRVEAPPDTAELEENLRNIREEMSTVEQQRKKDKEEYQAIEVTCAPLEREVEQANQECDKIKYENEKLADLIKKETAKYQTLCDKLAKYSDYEAKANQAIAKKEKEKEEAEKKVKEAIEKANQIAPRMNVDQSTTQLEKTIKNLEAQIQKEKSSRKKSVKEIETQYERAKSQFEEAHAFIKNIERTYELLSNCIKERTDRWNRMRAILARRTDLFFNSNLSKKGYSGKLNFSHSDESLEISVQLDKLRPGDQRSVVTNTKELSGGERSFSTVSFLLALWDNMENPFRAMDEFDVYMDSVNRSISIQLLIDTAKEAKSKQFIFITPHDHSAIAAGPEIRVQRMHPPIRGQATLVSNSSQNPNNEN